MISDTRDRPYSVFVSGPRARSTASPTSPSRVAASSLALASLLIEQLLDHDAETVKHSLRVARLVARIAPLLPPAVWAPHTMGAVYAAALVHDAGKILLPLAILTGTRALTPVERACVADHPYHGVALLAQYAPVSPLLGEACWGHHERWDGTGYPRRLAGPAIPLIARLVAVCDVYDAAMSDRPYRAGLTPAAALREIAQGAGTQFDPGLVACVLAHGLLTDDSAA